MALGRAHAPEQSEHCDPTTGPSGSWVWQSNANRILPLPVMGDVAEFASYPSNDVSKCVDRDACC